MSTPPEDQHPKENAYRYPGVTPFQSDQAELFFGRQTDTEQLYRLIRRESLVVLYGKSGLGKSSLINAGIIPQCKATGEYAPISIRFGAWTEQAEATPLEKIREGLDIEPKTSTYLDRLMPEDNSLWIKAKKQQWLQRHSAPKRRLLILFDQFEELFSYPIQQIVEFQKELVELLYSDIPLRFYRQLDSGAAGEISDEEDQWLETPLDARIVFAIRSDRMHLLDKLKEYLPNILRHNFELKALTIEGARSAIVEPAQAAGKFQTPDFGYTTAALDKLLYYLQDGEDRRVEGILLQMLCEHYERKLVEGENIRLLDLEQIGNPEQIIKKYYHEKVNDLPPTQQLTARLLIEEGLVSDGKAMRLSLHESYILQKFGVKRNLLDHLINSRLLRSEPFLRGGYTYELSHDRLVSPVLQARSQRRMEEAQREAELRQKELESTRKRLRLVIGLLVLTLSALAAAAYFGWNAHQRKLEAEIAWGEAKEQQTAAIKNLNDYKAENVAKDSLIFKDLDERSTIIVNNGGCAEKFLRTMRQIALHHPDSLRMKEKLHALQSRNVDCEDEY